MFEVFPVAVAATVNVKTCGGGDCDTDGLDCEPPPQDIVAMLVNSRISVEIEERYLTLRRFLRVLASNTMPTRQQQRVSTLKSTKPPARRREGSLVAAVDDTLTVSVELRKALSPPTANT